MVSGRVERHPYLPAIPSIIDYCPNSTIIKYIGGIDSKLPS